MLSEDRWLTVVLNQILLRYIPAAILMTQEAMDTGPPHKFIWYPKYPILRLEFASGVAQFQPVLARPMGFEPAALVW